MCDGARGVRHGAGRGVLGGQDRVHRHAERRGHKRLHALGQQNLYVRVGKIEKVVKGYFTVGSVGTRAGGTHTSVVMV